MSLAQQARRSNMTQGAAQQMRGVRRTADDGHTNVGRRGSVRMVGGARGTTYDARTDGDTQTERELVLDRHRDGRDVLWRGRGQSNCGRPPRPRRRRKAQRGYASVRTCGVSDDREQNEADELAVDAARVDETVDRVNEELSRDRDEL